MAKRSAGMNLTRNFPCVKLRWRQFFPLGSTKKENPGGKDMSRLLLIAISCVFLGPLSAVRAQEPGQAPATKRLVLQTGHTAAVAGVAMSADGRWLVSASWD